MSGKLLIILHSCCFYPRTIIRFELIGINQDIEKVPGKSFFCCIFMLYHSKTGNLFVLFDNVYTSINSSSNYSSVKPKVTVTR